MARKESTRSARGRTIKLLLGSLALVAVCVAVRHYWGAATASADPTEQSSGGGTTAAFSEGPAAPATRPRSAAGRAARGAADDESGQDERSPHTPSAEPVGGTRSVPPTTAPVPPVVAAVNNQRITRENLAQECLRHYGADVLESMVNKQLIAGECRRQGVTVTGAEVDAEIERMSKRFNIPVDQWLKMLKQERNVTPAQYANDIIWPTLALRKLAGERLTISREDLTREFETLYGPMVRVRLIAVHDLEKAKKLRAQAAAHAAEPGYFGNLAKSYSEDSASASLKGVINPIRMHGTFKEIEDAVFNMADGEVSQVINAGDQYVILKREGLIPAQRVTFEQIRPRLEEMLRDQRMHAVAKEIFERLQKEAQGKIEWVWNDPAKRRAMPGVAAVVLGSPITIRELAEECIARHGQPVLEGLINRRILEQACRRQSVTVSEAEIDAEITGAAAAGLPPKNGAPDVQGWLELVTKKQHISLEVYRHDVVWPIAALKKLVQGQVQVTEDDLRKGFEANFGPRVRCLAIVLDTQRRAQQVFEEARTNNTTEHFGDLAAQYSVEPGSQQLRGEVPPIKRHGGQPQLEEEAFALKPGDLSGIIQLGDKFVILRCEGFTKPAVENFAEVRDEIHRDVYEKKLHLAMAETFEGLQEAATVDDYLAGTSHSPKPSGKPASGPAVPTFRQMPSR